MLHSYKLGGDYFDFFWYKWYDGWDSLVYNAISSQYFYWSQSPLSLSWRNSVHHITLFLILFDISNISIKTTSYFDSICFNSTALLWLSLIWSSLVWLDSILCTSSYFSLIFFENRGDINSGNNLWCISKIFSNNFFLFNFQSYLFHVVHFLFSLPIF